MIRAHMGAGGAQRGRSLRRGAAVLLTPVALIGLGLGSWAFWLEPAALHNEDHELVLPGWPPACDGLRVAVLADLHTGSPHNGVDKLDRIVALTRAARPDLVLLAGDYVIHDVLGGHFVPIEETAKHLARIEAPLGVHAVLGNHDHWLGAEEVTRALERAGLTVHDDDAVPITKGACAFWLVGLDDLWEGAPDVDAALHDVPRDAPAIAFTHNPDLFPRIPSRVTLTVAGHTHGGQVSLPFFGRPIVPSRFGERYAAGHIVESGRHLFVSTGLGTSMLPVRFRVPPEVSVLTLRAAPATGSALAIRPPDRRADPAPQG